jgi:hypothetical protein
MARLATGEAGAPWPTGRKPQVPGFADRARRAQVAATVRQEVRGEVATCLNEGDREIDILVRSASG